MKRFWRVHGCWGAPSCTILLHISEICPSSAQSDDRGNTAPETLVSTNNPIRCGNPAFCYIISTGQESLNNSNSFSFHCDSYTCLCFSSTKININICPLLIQRHPCENLQEKCRHIWHNASELLYTNIPLIKRQLLIRNFKLLWTLIFPYRIYRSPPSCANELQ